MAKTPNKTQGKEQTGSQMTSLLNMMLSGGMNMPGFAGIGSPVTLDTYRIMQANPTIAIARVASRAPVKAGAKRATYVGDETIGAWLDIALADLWTMFMRESVNYGVDYGYQGFEQVWSAKDIDGRASFVQTDMKPLLADVTAPIIDKETGELVGLKNRKTDLFGAKMAWYAHDTEARNPYGRARLANCVKPWRAWEDTLRKMGQYVTKVAGVIPMVEYPQGESFDASGQKVSNWDIANAVLAQLGRGQGVTMPNTLAAWAEDLANRGVDTSKLRAWSIDFLEAKGQHGSDLVGIMQQMDKYLFRGYIVPERAVSEGTSGTKAEAATHADILIAAGQETLEDIVAAWNEQVVKPAIEVNFGAENRDAAWLETPELLDEKRAALRAILGSIAGSQVGLPTLMAALDLDAMLDAEGLPIREDRSANEEQDMNEADGTVALGEVGAAGSGLALSRLMGASAVKAFRGDR